MQFQRNDKKCSAQPASGGGPQRICSRQKSIRSGTARDSFSQTPHMRGKGLLTILTYMYFRVTPAHAGKSTGRTPKQCVFKDHPRVCGEKYTAAKSIPYVAGSPPHMRGKARFCNRRGVCKRITPAHAGKRGFSFSPWMKVQDHPRTCGEKARTLIVQNEPQGSPPHMRGKGGLLNGFNHSIRITPAHAGKRKGHERRQCTI